jgi:hypothetical protein
MEAGAAAGADDHQPENQVEQGCYPEPLHRVHCITCDII